MTTAPFIIISIGMKIEMEIEGRARLGGAVTGKKERERDSREKGESSRWPTLDSQRLGVGMEAKKTDQQNCYSMT